MDHLGVFAVWPLRPLYFNQFCHAFLFLVAKVSNLLISSDCSTPSVRAKLTRASWRRVMSLSSSASTASPGATGLPRLRFRGAPIGLSSINYCLLIQTNVCICIMHRFGGGFISSVVTLARED